MKICVCRLDNPSVESIVEERREENCSMIGNMPPKGVIFSDFIAIFAVSVTLFIVFGFATLR